MTESFTCFPVVRFGSSCLSVVGGAVVIGPFAELNAAVWFQPPRGGDGNSNWKLVVGGETLLSRRKLQERCSIHV